MQNLIGVVTLKLSCAIIILVFYGIKSSTIGWMDMPPYGGPLCNHKMKQWFNSQKSHEWEDIFFMPQEYVVEVCYGGYENLLDKIMGCTLEIDKITPMKYVTTKKFLTSDSNGLM